MVLHGKYDKKKKRMLNALLFCVLFSGNRLLMSSNGHFDGYVQLWWLCTIFMLMFNCVGYAQIWWLCTLLVVMFFDGYVQLWWLCLILMGYVQFWWVIFNFDGLYLILMGYVQFWWLCLIVMVMLNFDS